MRFGSIRRAVAATALLGFTCSAGAQGLLDIANELFAARKYEKALGGYEAVIAARPRLDAARLGAARTLIMLGRADDVIDALGDLPDRKPAVAAAKALLGEACYWQGEGLRQQNDANAAKMCYVDALIHLADATKADPSLHRAFYLQALAQRASDPNAWNEVAEFAGKAHALEPKNRDYTRLYGEALGRTGHDAKAAALLQELMKGVGEKVGPKEVATLMAAAASYGRAGDVDRAIATYERVFQATPDFYQQLWAAFGNEDAHRPTGVKILGALAARHPEAAMTHYYLGHLHQRMGRGDDAKAAFLACVKTREGASFSAAWGALAELAFQAKNEADCVTFARAALTADPNNEHAYGRMRAMVGNAMQRAEWVEAEERSRAMLDHRPNDPYEWANVANCLGNQRRYKEAFWAYERAVKLAPNNAGILTAAGSNIHFYSLPVVDPEEEAIRLYERALEINPKELYALENLGMILAKRGEFQRAATLLEQVLELQPGRGVAMREYNRARRGMKKAAAR